MAGIRGVVGRGGRDVFDLLWGSNGPGAVDPKERFLDGRFGPDGTKGMMLDGGVGPKGTKPGMTEGAAEGKLGPRSTKSASYGWLGTWFWMIDRATWESDSDLKVITPETQSTIGL